MQHATTGAPLPGMPRYPLPWQLGLRLAPAILRRGARSFGADARACVARLDPPLNVEGREHAPAAGPCLLTVNHYHRPDFAAWWLAFAISAVTPAAIHWVITDALTYPDPLRAALLTPLSRWVLRRIAAVYGFTAMPPMPPRPFEAAARARAVRRVLAHVRAGGRPVVGLAPEGGDAPGGVLQGPAPGAGRFLQHLAGLGMEFVPVGAWEASGGLRLRFGPRYRLKVDPAAPPAERDRLASRAVMGRIAALLPPYLRGESG